MTTTRRLVQLAFLALTLVAVFVVGANAERWCPFGGVEALYGYLHEGNMLCSLGVSNFYVLGGVVVMTIVLRRAFCGYMCPIGTISEWLGVLARRMRIRPLRVPGGLDRVLSLGKYVVLVAILYATWRAGELLFRGYDPCYALISRHGEDISHWAYIVAGAIVVVSLVVTVPFCRWFCPLAAVLNVFSRFGLTRIQRDEASCVGCGLCARACPMAIPVDQLRQVTSARCTSCMSCVEACPDKHSALGWGPPPRLGRRWSQAVLVLILLACTSGAVAAVYLFPLPSFVKTNDLAEPAATATVQLRVTDLGCRGRANLFFWFVDRDDLYAVPGYLKIEAWPGPGAAEVHISYDPAATNEEAIKQAITEPYFDLVQDRWRDSPFTVEGYDPLGR